MIKIGKWQYVDKTSGDGWMEGVDPALFDFDFRENKISPAPFKLLRQNLGFRTRLIQNYVSSEGGYTA